MLHAKVLYPPQFGATLVSLDASAAEAMPGVKVVHEGNFVAVAAPEAGYGREGGGRAQGAVEAGDGRGRQPQRLPVFQADRAGRRATAANLTPYTIAYIAHVPLEPRAAVAEWEGDKVTVWTGSQRPFGVRSELAQAFGIPEEKVRVIVPDTGSGYGGKHNGDAALEAARIAKAAGQAGEAQLDARGRDDVGVLPSGRPDRGGGQGGAGRHAHRVGVPQLQLGRLGAAIALQHSRERRSSSTSRNRRCGRGRTAAWRRRPTTSCANRTWTNWRNR